MNPERKSDEESEPNYVLVECDVSDGFFEGEKLISFTIGDRIISASVGPESITESNRLALELYEEQGDLLLVGIPGESFSSTRKLWIPRAATIR